MRTFIVIIFLFSSGCSLTQIQVRATYEHDDVKIEISQNISPAGLTR